VIRVIQVGLGAWGASWAHVLQASPHVELAALVDVDEAARGAVADAVGVPREACASTLAEAIGAVDADAVLVVVPPGAHEPVAIEALEAGLHCLIEKPLADTLAAAARIADAAEAAGLVAMTSQNYRFKRAPRTVRRLIDEGWIGDVELVRINFQKNPPFEGFRLEMDEPLITDMAIHHLDQIRSVTGLEPDRLRARSWNPTWSHFAGNACAQVELEAGAARVLYTGSWVSHGRHSTWDGDWDIQGSRGGISWRDNRVEVRFASLFDTVFKPGAVERDGVMAVDLDDVPYEERAGVLEEFAAAIGDGRPAETNARDNLRSLALVLGAVESAGADGNPVELSSTTPRTGDR
jgi:predicted dehydrogenase